jgi:N6-L-threonylcarbamoyladenine synthase
LKKLGISDATKIDKKLQSDLAASFQEAVCETLITKLYDASDKYHAKEIHLTGGVSANKRLRELLIEKNGLKKYKIRYPLDLSFCTDNAAMIASAAYFENFIK